MPKITVEVDREVLEASFPPRYTVKGLLGGIEGSVSRANFNKQHSASTVISYAYCRIKETS